MRLRTAERVAFATRTEDRVFSPPGAEGGAL
jgi:hypothetical protein